MLKLKNSAMLVVAGLCGYLALMTPDWKSDLMAAGGLSYSNDYTKDGTADVLMRNSSTGGFRTFVMSNGSSVSNNGYAAYGTGWDVVATEDFDGDKDTDVLMRNSSTGVWRMFRTENGAVVSDANFAAYSSLDWQVAAVADFNNDGIKDVLLHNTVAGGWTAFMISNCAVASSGNC